MGHKEQALEIVRTCEAADVTDLRAASNETVGLEALCDAASEGADILKSKVDEIDGGARLAAEAEAAAKGAEPVPPPAE